MLQLLSGSTVILTELCRQPNLFAFLCAGISFLACSHANCRMPTVMQEKKKSLLLLLLSSSSSSSSSSSLLLSSLILLLLLLLFPSLLRRAEHQQKPQNVPVCVPAELSAQLDGHSAARQRQRSHLPSAGGLPSYCRPAPCRCHAKRPPARGRSLPSRLPQCCLAGCTKSSDRYEIVLLYFARLVFIL